MLVRVFEETINPTRYKALDWSERARVHFFPFPACFTLMCVGCEKRRVSTIGEGITLCVFYSFFFSPLLRYTFFFAFDSL